MSFVAQGKPRVRSGVALAALGFGCFGCSEAASRGTHSDDESTAPERYEFTLPEGFVRPKSEAKRS